MYLKLRCVRIYVCFQQLDRVTGNTVFDNSQPSNCSSMFKNMRKQKFPLHVAKVPRSHNPVMTSRTPTTHVTVTSDPLRGVWCSDSRKRMRDGWTGLPAFPRSLGPWVRAVSSSRQQSLAAAWRIVHRDRFYLRTTEM